MRHTLVHLYGPFAIYSFGFMIVIGLMVYFYLLQHNATRKQLLSNNLLINVIMLGIVVALCGGKLLFLLSAGLHNVNFTEFIAFWDGGFSVLGSIIGFIIIIPLYLYWHHVPILPCMDLFAYYGPILQAISRIGCFCAGCCHGCTSDALWAVQYTDTESLAPLHVYLHPTQLYSSLLLITSFCLLFLYRKRVNYPGQLACLYIIFVSMERFIVDFFRGDREFFHTHLLSINQIIALILMVCAIIVFNIVGYTQTQRAVS